MHHLKTKYSIPNTKCSTIPIADMPPPTAKKPLPSTNYCKTILPQILHTFWHKTETVSLTY